MAPASLDRLASHNAVDGPVSAFDENIRLKGCDERAWVRLREDHHIVQLTGTVGQDDGWATMK